ncbi:MAG: Gfo/Idh/MocA family protein [Armatimonadota bacterium]
MAMLQPVRLGLVGLNFGRNICRELTQTPELPVQLAGVCDLDIAKAQAASVEFGVPVYPDLDAMLHDASLEAIGLFVGPNGRADLLSKIIRCGKDVMTTKPFEVDPEKAAAVLQEARSLGRVIHLNSPNARPYGEMAVIKEWIDAGAIGRPTLAQSSVWCYYGPTAADGSWYDDPLQCPLAPIFRLGIYPLNGLLTIFHQPETVQVTHSRVETQRPTPDNASATIGFRDGSIVNLVASFVVGGPDWYKNSMTIAGTKGVIYYLTGPRDRREGALAQVMLSSTEKQEVRELRTHSGEYDWQFFAQRIRGEVADDVTTIEQVTAVIHVMRAVSEAEQTGQTSRISA